MKCHISIDLSYYRSLWIIWSRLWLFNNASSSKWLIVWLNIAPPISFFLSCCQSSYYFFLQVWEIYHLFNAEGDQKPVVDFLAYFLWDVFNKLVDASFNFVVVSDLFELGAARVYHGKASFVGLLDWLSWLLLLILYHLNHI